MAFGALGVVRAETAVVATAFVGVLGTPTVGVAELPSCGVIMVPAGVRTCGVVTTVPPFATIVCAAAVCLANSAIWSIGFAAEGSGETNNSGGSKVGVAAGIDESDCVQAEINRADTTRLKIANIPRRLLLIVSPRSIYSTCDGST